MFRSVVKGVLALGEWGNEGLRAQARWELAVSRRILSHRKRVLLVALLPILALAGAGVAMAALPDTIGGSKAYLPAVVTTRMFLGSILVGLLAGLITGVIGAGGGYILTPALMSFGVRGIMAVGTDQFHLFAKAIMGTTIHRKLGNVNLGLAAWFVLGSIAGVNVGGYFNRKIYNLNPSLSDAFICAIYVVLLGILGFYALYDWVRLRKRVGAADSAGAATTKVARWMQGLPLRPRIRFDQDVVKGGSSVAVYPVILCGAFTGLLASIIGVGGGFVTFPMFVYGLGVSTFTTVGTGLLQITFTAAYSSILQYAIYGFVFYTVAMGMLLGSLIGVQVGAMVTTTVKGSVIRAFYALTILAGFVNRLAALPKKLSESGFFSLSPRVGTTIDGIGIVLFFALVGVFGVWVTWCFFRNLALLRGSEEPRPAGASGQLSHGEPPR